MIVTIVLSMILTPFIIKNIRFLADIFFKEPDIEIKIDSSGYENHVVIFGYGALGQKIAKKLKEMGIFYVIVEHSIELVNLAQKEDEPIILANAAQKSTLEAVQVRKSAAVIVAIENENKIRLMCEALTDFQDHINIVVKVANKDQEDMIADLKVNHVVNESREMADILIEQILTCKLN